MSRASVGSRSGNATPDRRGAVGAGTRRPPRAAGAPARTGLPGRRATMLGAGGAALRGAVAAQLGPRRFHRSRRSSGNRRRSRRRRDRAQSAARAILRPAGSSGSPYSPNSRLFLNPLYIDVEAIEEFDRRAADLQDIRCARRELVDYAGRCGAKIAALRAAYGLSREQQRSAPRRLRSPIGPSAAGRSNASPPSRRCAAIQPGAWWEWPEPWRQPGDAALAPAAREPSRRDRLP